MFACQNGNQSEMTAVCTQTGKWEPNPTDVCAPGKINQLGYNIYEAHLLHMQPIPNHPSEVLLS